ARPRPECGPRPLHLLLHLGGRGDRVRREPLARRGIDDSEGSRLSGLARATRLLRTWHEELLRPCTASAGHIFCGCEVLQRTSHGREARFKLRPAMNAPRAWVAQLGQRRSVEVAVPKGFAGSNPAPRI